MSHEFQLLKTRRFLPLFLTQFLGAFNDNVFKNALVILITYNLGELVHMKASELVAVATGIFILPFLLFSAISGQLADKYERSKLIRYTKLIEVVLALCAIVGFYFQSVWWLLGVLFLLGTQATFFGPLKYAILPDHLKRNELIAGNGFVEGGTFLAVLLGTILSGVLVMQKAGEPLISGLMLFVAVAGLICSRYIPKAEPPMPNLKLNSNLLGETLRIVNYTRRIPRLFLSIIGISWFWLIGAIFLSELPPFVKDTLHSQESVVTWFFTLFSVGIAIGSVLCNRLVKGRIETNFVPLCGLLMSIFIFDFYSASHTPILAPSLMTLSEFLHSTEGAHISLDLLFMAISAGIYIVPLYTVLQTTGDTKHRARVIASNNIMNAMFMVLSAALSIVLLKMGLTVDQLFLTIAILNVGMAIYLCRLWPLRLVKTILRFLFRLFYRIEVEGMENYYNAGSRVVIVANHSSFLDAAIITCFLPDSLTYAVNTVIAEQWWAKPFLALVNAFPIDQTKPLVIRQLIRHVQQDVKCLIFPEGRITVTGAVMKIYEGPGLIADRAQAKLLPICIQGAEYTFFSRLRGKTHLRFAPKIKVKIYPPVDISVSTDLRGRARRQYISNRLYEIITDMVFHSKDLNQTLYQVLLDSKRIYGRKHIIVEDVNRRPLSYQKLLVRINVLGRVIAKNTQRKEHVGVLLPNSIAVLATFFGLLAYERVPVMLNFTSGERGIASACKTAAIKKIYTSRLFIEKARLEKAIAHLIEQGVEVIYLEEFKNQVGIIDKVVGLLRSFQHKHRTQTDPINDTATILFTSGSEGEPKGVALSHRNLLANCYQVTTRLDLTPQDRVFNVLPMFHSSGLSVGTLIPLFAGVKIFLYPSPLHYRMVPELVYDTDSTILLGTNVFLHGYARFAHPYDFYSTRLVFAGAEKLKDETRQMWVEKFGVRILEGYGATETSPMLTLGTPMHNKIGSVGRFLPDIQYKLIPVDDLPNGGELSVTGPNIMLGYILSDRPNVIQPPKDNYYNTGDVVHIDAEGYVFVHDRKKRFAKIAGEMISLTQVENYLEQLWPKFQHAILANNDTRKGERLVLFTTNPNATRKDIIDFVRQNGYSELSIPRDIQIIEKMPLMATGKVQYGELKKLLA